MKQPDKTLRTISSYQLRRTAVQAMVVVNNILRQYGLRRTTFASLSVVIDEPGIKQGTLADVLAVDRPNIVKIIDTLEEEGLLIREKVLNDRRVYALMPTEKGITLADKVTADIKRLDDDLLAGLSEHNIKTFQDVLLTVEENAKRGS